MDGLQKSCKYSLSSAWTNKDGEKSCDDIDIHSANATNTVNEDEGIAVTEFFIFRVPSRLQYQKNKPFGYSYTLTMFFSVSTAIRRF